MRNAIFVYNPLSGDRSIPGKLNYVIDRFQKKGILIQPYQLNHDSFKILPGVLEQNHYDFIVVSGGDGTLNSIVNQLLKNDLDLPVGIIPSGTCNDFARCLNISPILEKSLDIILDENIKEVDVGFIDEEKYFLSTCAGGLFVDVSFNTDNELKKNFGSLAYYLKALSEVVHVKSFPLKVTTENETIQVDTVLFLVSNGKHAAGFSNIVEDASITDGMMDIVLIKNCSHIDLAGLFFKVLSNELLNDTHVTKLRARECTFESTDNVSLSIDGEKGISLPNNIKFINKGLKVFAPV